MTKEKVEKNTEEVITIAPPREETFEEREAREKREAFIKRNMEARKGRAEILKRNNLPKEPVRELTEDEIQRGCCG